ncbi:MAG TPA: FAD-dependent oxidoreductase [Gemmatimonadaceae bacterium]|nr:FAD-dependent oxidoreductase [Gemmatimonadaceae bacterium]
MTPAARPDAIVVGAGVVGAACALALARDGRRVLVLDGRTVASGTTSAGMGHLVALDDSPAQLALSACSLRLWRELLPELGDAVAHRPIGTLWLAEDDAQLAALAARRDGYAAAGVEAELLDARELAATEPALCPGLAGALRVPGDGVLDPPAAARRLLALAREHGAELRESCAVHALGPHEARGADDVYRAEVIVNAAGAWAPRLTPALPIVPRKGHLVLGDAQPELCRHQLVETGYLASAHALDGASVAFNVQPRPGGRLAVGSSRELAGWDASVNEPLVVRMLERARHFLPGLATLRAERVCTGFRPATPDGLPYVGRWPALAGQWVAAGHEGLGLTTAPGTARLLADLVAGREPAIDARPYDPARVLQPHGA